MPRLTHIPTALSRALLPMLAALGPARAARAQEPNPLSPPTTESVAPEGTLADLLGDEDEAPRVRLRWTAPRGCPSEERFKDSVRERIDGPLDDPKHSSIELAANVHYLETDSLYVAELHFSGDVQGSREYRDRDCGHLTEQAARETAHVLLHGELPASSPPPVIPPTPQGKTTTKTPTAPAPTPDSELPPKPPSPRLLRGLLEFSAGPALFLFPDDAGTTNAILTLSGGLIWQDWRFAAAGSYALPRRYTETQGSTTLDSHFSGGWAALEACWMPNVNQRWYFPMCLGGEFGAMGTTPGPENSTADSEDDNEFWVAARAGPGATVRLADRFTVGIKTDFVLPFFYYKITREDLRRDYPVTGLFEFRPTLSAGVVF